MHHVHVNFHFSATGNHPDLTWSDQGKALLCSEPTEGETSPVPSSIDPAITRDPDTGEAWLSFGGGYIYTVKLAADLWLEAGQDWFPEAWPQPSGFNYVANGLEPNGDEGWVEAPFLHPIMVNMYVYLSRQRHFLCKLSDKAKVLL